MSLVGTFHLLSADHAYTHFVATTNGESGQALAVTGQTTLGENSGEGRVRREIGNCEKHVDICSCSIAIVIRTQKY